MQLPLYRKITKDQNERWSVLSCCCQCRVYSHSEFCETEATKAFTGNNACLRRHTECLKRLFNAILMSNDACKNKK